MRHSRSLRLIPLLFSGVTFGSASAQDVEMLGRRFGTVPPASYFEARGRDETAFQFRRGMAPAVRMQLAAERAGAARGGPALALGPRTGPVTGTYRVPVLTGLYSNSSGTPPYTRDAVEAAYFSAQSGTISDYYAEVSGGRVTLIGDVFDWRQISKPDTTINRGESGLFSDFVGGGGAGNFVYELLSLQVGIDWGLYDNDGPDGVPNSGDDDGFVDVVAVIHPTRGGECAAPGSGDRIWSHRWSLSSAVFATFETTTPAANGGFIRVDDYTIQPAISCSGGEVNQIGIFTHELGHAFGLPDLYDTDSSNGRHAGAGIWDLMSSGSWGCNNASPSRPCHMGAWTKAQLGWVDVVTLGPDTDHGTVVIPPVESDGVVYRVDANDGSGEYFLLENRQRLGYDQLLFSEGLLVWQIDPDWVAARWPANTVNGDPHQGVWLRQADGLDQLSSFSNPRGDGGDPFPGASGNDAFHASSVPAATSFGGGVTGVTLYGITEVGDDVELGLSTRFTTLTLSATGASSPTGLFTLDGRAVDPPETTFVSAPFVEHVIEAVAGEAVTPGERRPFISWSDAPAEPRVRTVTTGLADSTLSAAYGGTQYRMTLSTSGGVGGVQPGTFVTSPTSADLWFDGGTPVSVEVQPLTGFGFLGWSGDFAGQGNPASVTVAAPVTATADFELLYSVQPVTIDLIATEAQDTQLLASGGTPPYSWRVVGGALPLGLSMSGIGRITGASIDVGSYDVTVQATDANGLPAEAVVTLAIDEPVLPIEALTSSFLLSGPALTSTQLNFLNRQGNGVSGYDLGDFRAWVLAHPELPLSSSFEGRPQPKEIRIPMTFHEQGPSR